MENKLVPIYGFLEGDTLGLLLLAYEKDTVEVLIQKLQDSACVRVAPRPEGKLYFKGKVLGPNLTLDLAGIKPLDRVDVKFGYR